MANRQSWVKILVVILIVDALLIATGYWLYKRNQLPSESNELQAQMKALGRALDLYYQDCKTFPSEAQGLSVLREPPKTEPLCEPWAGPYLEDTDVKDPWGRDFVYKREGEFYSLQTLGADGKEGGLGKDMDLALDEF